MNGYDLYMLMSLDCDHIIKKRTNQREIDVLKILHTCDRTPSYIANDKNIVYMTKVGTSLRDLIGQKRVNEGKRVVREHYTQLHQDIYSALQCLHSKGIKHLDLERGAAMRNITWDGDHFNIIDFDKIEYNNNYDWKEQADDILDWLREWSK